MTMRAETQEVAAKITNGRDTGYHQPKAVVNRKLKKIKGKKYTKRDKSKNKLSRRAIRRLKRSELRKQRIRQSPRAEKWQGFRKKVYKNYGYKCKVCGQGGKLHAHHLVPKSIRPDFTYELENCICLCEKCHMELPSSNKEMNKYKEEWEFLLTIQERIDLENWIETKNATGFSLKDFYRR